MYLQLIDLGEQTFATNRRVRACAENLRAQLDALLFTYRSHRFPHVHGASDARDEILAGLRILVVDDDADSRDLLQQAFGFLGAMVVTAKSAEDALRTAADADVVVTDFPLPEKDGTWLLAQINAWARPIPVILLSGYCAQHSQAVADAPFALKLLKPVDPWDVARAIRATVVSASATRG